VSTSAPMKVDGILNETDWLKRYDYLVFGANAQPGDVCKMISHNVYYRKPSNKRTNDNKFFSVFCK
ncbi:MAG: hypothetical protein ACYC49_12590, partial [Ignavibacteriaceae bacterium]